MGNNNKENVASAHIENHERDYFVEHFRKKTNWSMPRLHLHNTYEIYYLISGDVQYSIGHRLYEVNPGDIVIIPKNTTHRTLSRSDRSVERILVYFSDNFISSFSKHLSADAFEAFSALGCVRLGKEQQNRAYRIFNKMLEIHTHPDKYSEAEIFTLLCELIIMIMRHGHAVERITSDTTESKIMDAVDYIKNNFSQELSLTSVAKIVCMESTYFSKSFRKITGFKFHDYVLQTRLTESIEYLLNTPLSISQIAEECGFTSGNHFGDVFKKHKGMSPREFQKQNKENAYT